MMTVNGMPLGWRSIETAPKSGELILLWWKTCDKPAIGWWEYNEFWDDDDVPPEQKTVPEGWRNEGDQLIPRNQSDCTHWMELPKPPTESV